jgi:hypothetical protein
VKSIYRSALWAGSTEIFGKADGPRRAKAARSRWNERGRTSRQLTIKTAMSNGRVGVEETATDVP